MSWIAIIISVTILSFSKYNYLKKLIIGFSTFIFAMFLVYIIHRNSHNKRNIFTILHHYHHEHNNFFSHFIQILIEISFIGIFLPIYYLFGTILLDPFVLIMVVFFYSSVHNINYSYFHVNHVHELHHQFIHTNIGPDICDIIFNTKHSSEHVVENTNHYILNVIVATSIAFIIKYFWQNIENKSDILYGLNCFFITAYIILFISSVIVLHQEEQ